MTPLIKITDRIYAKLETYHPTGSVKDRLIKYLIEDGIASGKIIPKKTKFIEATSGNTGISLASCAAKLGCSCTIIMPGNMSNQRKIMMKAFGADIIETDDNDFLGSIALRDRIIGKHDDYWCPYQFKNLLNIECHFETTAKEICNQAADYELKWSTFVHGSGTGGTMMGVKKFIDTYNLDVSCVLTVPFENSKDHGIQGINDGEDFLLDRYLMNEIIEVKTADAINRMKKFSHESGLLVGISSGANLCAAETYIRKFNPDGIIITMLSDRGERYL